VPAYRSATTRASLATCGVSTGSPDGTCDSGSSLPVKSVASSSDRTNPSSSWPLNRTRTRHPACTVSANFSGTA
jgi:hypothetical protein